MRSFKSNENIHKKEGGSYYLVSANKASSVTLQGFISSFIPLQFSYEPGHEKMCLMPYANNKGADQPAHLRSLISAFVVRCEDRMISLVYISEISRF